MPRDYRVERDAIVERFYGAPPTPRNPRANRSSRDPSLIGPQDAYCIPAPLNSPYDLYGHCLAWAYSINDRGYGILTIDGQPQRAHRVAYSFHRGAEPGDLQINHLCDRPYCIQPTHLYAGTPQDNSDDRALFNSNHFMNAYDAARMDWPTDNPLTLRMKLTKRTESADHWDPVIKPVHPSLHPFSCPDHDYSIPMQGRDAKVCRICDTTSLSADMIDKTGITQLIARLWPVSQASAEIFSQFFNSGIKDPQLADNVRSLADRCFSIGKIGEHDPRDCQCYLCDVDRRAINNVVLPKLHPDLQRAINIAEELRPVIRAAMEAAHREAMRIAAQRYQLDDHQTEILVDHIALCTSEDPTTRDNHSIEEAFAAATYSIATRQDPALIDEPDWRSKAAWAYYHTEVPAEDSFHALTAAHHARRATADLAAAWLLLLEQAYPTTPEDETRRSRFTFPASVISAASLFETIRYQASGQSSSQSKWPEPHHHCAAQIAANGAWSPFPTAEPFREGQGYNPDEDAIRRDHSASQSYLIKRSYTQS